MNRSHFINYSIGAIMIVCSLGSMGLLSNCSYKKAKMYERVDEDRDGDVYITTTGKKYHQSRCFFIKRAVEVKQASRADVIEVGYKPCKKCRP